MKPVPPRLGVSTGQETIIAKAQPPYLPLIAHVYGSSCHGSPVVTRWRLSWRERLAILIGRDVFLKLLTFGGPLQPIHITLEADEVRYLTSDEHTEQLERRGGWRLKR